MKLELGPVNMFPLSAGAMFSLSTESDGGMVQGMTERELLTPALVHFSELHLWTAARGTQETQQCSPSSPFDWHLAHFYLPALAYQHPHVRVPIIQGAVATPSPTRRSESQPWGAAGSHEKRVFPVCSFWGILPLPSSNYWYGFCLLTERWLTKWSSFIFSVPCLYFQDVLFFYNCIFKDLFITHTIKIMCVCICAYINSPLLNPLHNASQWARPSVYAHQKCTHMSTETCRIFITALFTTAKKCK